MERRSPSPSATGLNTVRLLLHCCCGPCSLYPVQVLQQQGVAVTGCFYNPNIHPLQEYLRRREGMAQAADHLSLPMEWLDAEYHPATFLEPLQDHTTRCEHCYRLRLERVASLAVATGHSAISSTLLYSKYQDHTLMRRVGEEVASAQGLTFLYNDFRVGWQDGIDQSKAMRMYRQQYCGCIYSEFDRYQKKLRALSTS